MFKATNSVLRFGSRAFQVPISSSPKPLYSSRSRLPSLRPQLPLQVARFASKSEDPPPPRQPIDREAELKVAHQKLEPRPSEVSVDSSTTRAWDSTIPVMTSPGTSGESSMNAGLQHDIVSRNAPIALGHLTAPDYFHRTSLKTPSAWKRSLARPMLWASLVQFPTWLPRSPRSSWLGTLARSFPPETRYTMPSL